LAGFIVCASCGTQIKAGRAYCLRCGEDLPVEGAPGKFSAWESLELPRHKVLILLGVVALSVLMLLVVIWQTQPVPEYEVVQPLNRPGAVERIVPAPAAESAVPAESPRPAPSAPSDVPKTALDATRSGVAAYRAGNYDSARAAFERSVALSPDDAEALNNLGQTLVRLNRVSEAVSRFERAVVLAPNKAPFHFNLAHAMGLLGKWDRAVAEYRASVRLVPDDSAAQYNFASALHKKGDDEAAIPEFQKAIELAPGEAGFHLSLGTSLEQVGRVAEAAREYEIFLEMAPTAPEAEKLRAHLEALASARKRSPTA
jgi:Flp pilus assembly protein TadD